MSQVSVSFLADPGFTSQIFARVLVLVLRDKSRNCDKAARGYESVEVSDNHGTCS